MAFREIMTGGACNTQDSQNQRSMNPLNRLVENLSLGPQQSPSFRMDMSQQQNVIRERQEVFNQMNLEWNNSQQQVEQHLMQQKQMMNLQWEMEQQNMMEQMYIQQQLREQEWIKEEQNYLADQMVQQYNTQQDATKQQVEQQQILQAADSMIDIMRKDLSPRFKNSKFLAFLESVQSKQIIIEGDQLIENTQNIMENAFTSAQQENLAQQQNFESIYHQSEEAYKQEQEEFAKIWEKEEFEYMKDLQNMDQTYQEEKQGYEFQKENQFSSEDNHFAKAQQLIAEGQPILAILCLEAGLQMKDSSKSWHLLGRLHQENDDDTQAVKCLLKAHEMEPENLDILLNLGVSCTNNLNEQQAMGFLKSWLQNNPKYQMCQINNQNDINSMLELFNQARNIQNLDSELLTALSVLHFINRDYDSAVQSFKEALQCDPQNYSLWNKLGATLAHQGKSEESISAYHRALDLKPNFVRAWVNLGISYSYQQNYKEAARLYLNAISFNPNAEHLWQYLQTNFMCLQRFDLVEKTVQRDIQVFRQEFQILDLKDLPKPEIDYGTASRHFLMQEKDWVQQFQQK